MDIFRKAAGVADSLLATVAGLVQKAETRGNTYRSADAVGSTAEVSISIPAGGTGEVLLKLGRGLHNYPARAARDGEAFMRGTKVLIADVGEQTIFVEALPQKDKEVAFGEDLHDGDMIV